MRERVSVKSPVRENRPPGSVRGAPGNRRPYRDRICHLLLPTRALRRARQRLSQIANDKFSMTNSQFRLPGENIEELREDA